MTLPNIKWAMLYGVVLCNACDGEFGAVSVVSNVFAARRIRCRCTSSCSITIIRQPAHFAAASILAVIAIFYIIAKVALGLGPVADPRKSAAHPALVAQPAREKLAKRSASTTSSKPSTRFAPCAASRWISAAARLLRRCWDRRARQDHHPAHGRRPPNEYSGWRPDLFRRQSHDRHSGA